MSEHGAALQTYNQELVKCLEDLKLQRNRVHEEIVRGESEKNDLEKKIKLLQEKLTVVNNNLNQHRNLKVNFDKAIKDTELGFKKILESSQTLLNLVQHEVSKLGHTSHKNHRNNHNLEIENGL